MKTIADNEDIKREMLMLMRRCMQVTLHKTGKNGIIVRVWWNSEGKRNLVCAHEMEQFSNEEV